MSEMRQNLGSKRQRKYTSHDTNRMFSVLHNGLRRDHIVCVVCFSRQVGAAAMDLLCLLPSRLLDPIDVLHFVHSSLLRGQFRRL